MKLRNLSCSTCFSLIFGILVAVAASQGSGGSAPAQGPQPNNALDWKRFENGMAAGKTQNKYVFVDVYADWCGYCHQMDNFTFTDPEVKKELEKNWVSVKFNSESNESVTWEDQQLSHTSLASIWGVSSLPTLLFFNSKGEMVGSYPGYADAELFHQLLTYVSSGAREKGIAFSEYLEKEQGRSGPS